MRQLVLRVPCPCAATTFWRLREDPRWDAVSAAEDGQVYVPVETTRCETVEGPHVHRVSRLEQRWPSTLRRLLRVRDELHVHVTTSWYTRRHDEDHPCHIRVEVPMLGDRFEIVGRLWVEAVDDESCTLCTRYTIDARASVLTKRIEDAIEEKMRATYADQPRRVVAYLCTRCVVARPVAAPSAGAIPVNVVEIVT